MTAHKKAEVGAPTRFATALLLDFAVAICVRPYAPVLRLRIIPSFAIEFTRTLAELARI